MIEFTKAYKTSDALTWPTLELAQQHELEILALSPSSHLNASGNDMESVVAFLLAMKIHLIDILTMTPTSKPKARSVNGGTKKRRTKAEMAAANAALQDPKP